jgi:hypothetical protein
MCGLIKRFSVIFIGTILVATSEGHAQVIQPQIPTLQVCNVTSAKGSVRVALSRRAGPSGDTTPYSGTFGLTLGVNCNPRQNGYPSGTLRLEVDMSDSAVRGLIRARTVEQLTSTGTATPMLFVSGRCDISIPVPRDGTQLQGGTPSPGTVSPPPAGSIAPPVAPIPGGGTTPPISTTGCRYWVMVADNNSGNPRATRDTVGFLVLNGEGKRLAYGSGPGMQGDIVISPTMN